MNEIAQQRISEKVIEALDKEMLSKNQAGPMVGINPSYLSIVVNPEKFYKCPNASWEILQKWVNSGMSIRQYAIKHGHLTTEEKKPEEVIPEKIFKVAPPITVKEPEPIKEKPLIKIRPRVKEAREVELKKKEERLTPGQMIDFLIEERESHKKEIEHLKQKIDAIEVLLKHYIS
jgi:hypothetical protein